jgi:hypothetical protein
MLSFNPKAATESAVIKELMPEGVYRFKTVAAKQKFSKSGNDMIEITLNIFNKNTSGSVKDYLGDWPPYGSQKILGYLDSVGLPTLTGALHVNQIVGREGYLKLVQKTGADPRYPGPQNNVLCYYTTQDLVINGKLPKGTAPLLNPDPPPAPGPVTETAMLDLGLSGTDELKELPF